MPASKSVRDQLLRGEPVHFGGSEPEDQRTIPADWIAEAAKKGARVQAKHAVIAGALNLKYATIEQEFRLIACDVLESADFSYATFKGNLVCSGTTFRRGADFDDCVLDHNLRLNRAKFFGRARITDVHVRGVFRAVGTRFSRKASFSRARIEKDAVFQCSTFEDEADFATAHIGGDANFQGAVLKQKVSFNGATIDGAAIFRSVEPKMRLPAARFESKADFIAIHIGLAADFDGAQFNGKDKPISFDSAKIDGNAFFRGASFAGPTTFAAAHIGGHAQFEGAVFNQKVSFNSANIGEAALFRSPGPGLPAATFKGETDFIAVHIGAGAVFDGAQFNSTDPTSFDSAKIDSNAFFRGANFAGPTTFAAAHIGGHARFEGAVFKQKARFNAAKIEGSAFFRGNPAQNLPPAIFEGEADFTTAQISGEANFCTVVFKQKARFNTATFEGSALFGSYRTQNLPAATFEGEADFIGAHMGGLAEFTDVVFHAVYFDHTRFADDARFEDTIFKAPASFRETSFRVVYFSSDGKAQGREQFQNSIDLRGCTYERIQVHWPSLLKRPDARRA